MSFLLIIVLIIITILLGKLAVKLGFSEVVGQLLAGVILGTSLLNWVQSTALIHLLAEIGIAMLMFHSGLSSDLKVMKQHIKASSAIAVFGVVVPVLVMPLAFILLGYDLRVALFSGVVFAATSISITLAVLAEQRKLATSLGAIILSAAILDDVIALIAMTVFSVILGGQLGLGGLVPLVAFTVGLLIKKYTLADYLEKGTAMAGKWFFYPIFFGSIGLTLALPSTSDKIVAIIIFSILAILTKLIGSFLGAKLSGLSSSVATAIGAGMVSRGEMALVIIQIGISSGIVSQNLSSEMIVTVMITTIVAPLIMKPLFKNIKEP
ncbi:cation:proton antiporter [Leuconostoc falkenbergense]|uniref:cation:proton antiporter n=1 Tax=Leuconostoc falkenbergense TaxID=2766470 RepID=UPI0024ACBE5A|nr:cation:proton antiporter [Leuconostoc falkenbergense]MDI6667973.1 cation:proton antiporter [Leuconostoc falkenbergense]